MIEENRAFFGLRHAYAATAELQSGEFLWRRIPPRGSRSWANASWAKSENYLFRPAGTFQALDPQTGNTIWETDVNRGGEAGPVYRNNRVFYANPYDRPGWAVHAMNAESGDILWQTPIKDVQAYQHMSSPAVDKQYVYFAMQGRLFALNKEDGEVVWETEGLGNTDVSPVIAGDYVYLVNNNGRLFGVESDTGNVVWHFDLGVKVSSGMALSGNTLFITARNGALYAFVPTEVQ